MNKRILALTLWFAALPLLNAQAQTAEEKGLQIAQEADVRDTGWKSQSSTMKMILRNAEGRESTRAIRSKTLEVSGDGDKALSIFDTPPDVKGTAFLSYTHVQKADEQWLYLPALKRVKRISSNNKSGPFMGSEFAYEDISSQEVGKYTYKWLRDEKIENRDCFVVERVPTYKHSGYTRLITWMDKQTYRPLKIDFYDRKNELMKTLTQHEFKQYLDKYWRPSRMEMKNHVTNKSTTLLWENFQFGINLSDKDFDRNALKRIR
ncbi:MAG: outer membrane lipoprotein-sorting protein [Gammaproteobacteria bacterium]|nr:outer membrane lipoprotein-sorting protein [Gammaproteobacteria bacterium]MDH5801663.1 outer membrane lipoprotein-sorting protein [Gammaproteobacteria bacterium]